MLIFISGGVRSGKSALGERVVLNFPSGRKVYLATSAVCDGEMERRVERHRADRAGKGFVTVERSAGLSAVLPALRGEDAVLLDCLGAWTANEMFGSGAEAFDEEEKAAIVARMLGDVAALNASVSLLAVVSNDLFSDGVAYAGGTADYLDVLARLHRGVAAMAGAAVECAAGIPVIHKGSLPN